MSAPTIPYRTRTYEPNEASASGDRIVPTYSLKIVNGVEQIVQDGETDLWAYIQTFSDSCSLESIVKRAQLGDIDALNQRSNAFFADVRALPKTLLEAKEFCLKIDQFFDKLPIEIKNQFANSSDKFADALSDASSVQKIFEDYYRKNSSGVVSVDNEKKEMIDNGSEK